MKEKCSVLLRYGLLSGSISRSYELHLVISVTSSARFRVDVFDMHNTILTDTLTSANELVVHTSTNIINQSDREASCKFIFLFNLIFKRGLQRGLFCFGSDSCLFLIVIFFFFSIVEQSSNDQPGNRLWQRTNKKKSCFTVA